jgi:hypothetical protein
MKHVKTFESFNQSVNEGLMDKIFKPKPESNKTDQKRVERTPNWNEENSGRVGRYIPRSWKNGKKSGTPNGEIKGDVNIIPFKKLKEDLLKIDWIKKGEVDTEDVMKLYNLNSEEEFQKKVWSDDIDHETTQEVIKKYLEKYLKESDDYSDLEVIVDFVEDSENVMSIFIGKISNGKDGKIEGRGINFDIWDLIEYYGIKYEYSIYNPSF